MQATSTRSNSARSKPARRSAGAAAPAGARALHTHAGEAATLLKALANPDRLLLLCHLVHDEKTVTELGELSGVAQPSLSQQLSVLRAERLVATRREGKSIFYRIAAPAVHAVLQTLHKLYCQERGSGPAHKRKKT